MLKAKQRLHREELKLARLKTKQNKERRLDARLKLRLGGLCYVVGWNELDSEHLEMQILSVSALIKSGNTETLSIQGSNLLSLLTSNNIRSPASTLSDPEKRREAIHRQITVGGMLVKHELQNYSKSILLGAIYTVSDFTDFNQIAERRSQENTK